MTEIKESNIGVTKGGRTLGSSVWTIERKTQGVAYRGTVHFLGKVLALAANHFVPLRPLSGFGGKTEYGFPKTDAWFLRKIRWCLTPSPSSAGPRHFPDRHCGP